GPVGHSGPAVHMAAIPPVLAAVVAGACQRKRLAKHGSIPGNPGRISRLAGPLSRLGDIAPLGYRLVAGQIVHDAGLHFEIGSIRQVKAMLHANLRYPSPKISSVAESRDSE